MNKNELKLAIWLLGLQRTLMNRLLKAAQENPNNEYLVEETQNAVEAYLKTSERVRMLLDKLEHETIRMGLQLRYVNRLPWSQVVEHVGDDTVEAQCNRFMRKGGEYSV